MNKVERACRMVVDKILSGENNHVLAVVPNIGAVANMRHTILSICDAVGMQYNVLSRGNKIVFLRGGSVEFVTLADDVAADGPPPQIFSHHRDAAIKLVEVLQANPGIRVVAVAPNYDIARYARDLLCDELSAKLIHFQAPPSQWLIKVNNTFVDFYAAHSAQAMRGRRFQAIWAIAPNRWQGREASALIDACVEWPMLTHEGYIESFG